MRADRAFRQLVPIAVTLLAAGCSGHVGSVRVGHDKLERLVSERLTASVGQRPDSIRCPHDLKGTVGATTRCTLTAGTDRLGVTVRTTSVQGSRVKFAIKVDDRIQR